MTLRAIEQDWVAAGFPGEAALAEMATKAVATVR